MQRWTGVTCYTIGKAHEEQKKTHNRYALIIPCTQTHVGGQTRRLAQATRSYREGHVQRRRTVARGVPDTHLLGDSQPGQHRADTRTQHGGGAGDRERWRQAPHKPVPTRRHTAGPGKHRHPHGPRSGCWAQRGQYAPVSKLCRCWDPRERRLSQGLCPRMDQF